MTELPTINLIFTQIKMTLSYCMAIRHQLFREGINNTNTHSGVKSIIKCTYSLCKYPATGKKVRSRSNRRKCSRSAIYTTYIATD